jgi:hypothetical protein
MKDREGWRLSDLAIDLNKLVTPANQLWVGSGYTTVNPVLGSVLGVADVLSPPFSGRNFLLKALFVANGDTIRDQFVWGSKPDNILYTGGSWQPDRVIRRGTYHRRHAGGVISFEIVTYLIPLADRMGFMIRYEVKNRASAPLAIRMIPSVDPGYPSVIPLKDWGFMPPPWGTSPAPYGFSPPTRSIVVNGSGETQWNTDEVKGRLYQEGGDVVIDSGERKTGYVGVLFSETVPLRREKSQVDSSEALRGDAGALRKGDGGAVLPERPDFAGWERSTDERWAKRLKWALGSIPIVRSKNVALENYYKRAIASGLVCIWEKPEFVMSPSLVTSGLDGGSMTSYIWDIAGYAPNMMTMMMGDKMPEIARYMASIDLEKYNAYTPDGVGTGVRYAYSTVAYTALVYAITCHREIYPDLFEQARRLIVKDEERPMVNGVIDYGEQKNLLEMRGMGWEHRVPSPNAERVWCFRKLAEMGARAGYAPGICEQWKKRSDSIAAAIRKELWDEEAGWFDCKYPDGHRERVYSIQVFDMLRTGVCTPAMKRRMVAQLVENKFLFPYGVSSVAKSDSLHYEVTDTDWGGGGSYSGDVPQLALDLYHEHMPRKAWDVLRRQFWLGELEPYFPQEHFCDRPASPGFKRANIIAGLTGAEAILFGLVGLDPRPDGSLWIDPQVTGKDPIEIRGFGYRGHVIDMIIAPASCMVSVDGRVKYRGRPKMFRVL